jgi:hypothetical protein
MDTLSNAMARLEFPKLCPHVPIGWPVVTQVTPRSQFRTLMCLSRNLECFESKEKNMLQESEPKCMTYDHTINDVNYVNESGKETFTFSDNEECSSGNENTDEDEDEDEGEFIENLVKVIVGS